MDFARPGIRFSVGRCGTHHQATAAERVLPLREHGLPIEIGRPPWFGGTQALSTVASALVRRFVADYEVRTADSSAAGLDALEQLARRGAQVALVAAELHLPDINGLALLESAHALHRRASRVLLVESDQNRTVVLPGALSAYLLWTPRQSWGQA